MLPPIENTAWFISKKNNSRMLASNQILPFDNSPVCASVDSLRLFNALLWKNQARVLELIMGGQRGGQVQVLQALQ